MATRTQIEARIKSLDPAKFQEFCDELIRREEKGVLVSLGKQDARNKTTKGSPDSYIRKDNGHYIFMEYTMMEHNLFNKIESDICKCFDHKLTNLNNEFIDKIIYCHTSSNINPGNDKKLHNLCQNHGVELVIYGINELVDRVEIYPTLIRDYLGLNISTSCC